MQTTRYNEFSVRLNRQLATSCSKSNGRVKIRNLECLRKSSFGLIPEMLKAEPSPLHRWMFWPTLQDCSMDFTGFMAREYFTLKGKHELPILSKPWLLNGFGACELDCNQSFWRGKCWGSSVEKLSLAVAQRVILERNFLTGETGLIVKSTRWSWNRAWKYARCSFSTLVQLLMDMLHCSFVQTKQILDGCRESTAGQTISEFWIQAVNPLLTCSTTDGNVNCYKKYFIIDKRAD